jgi:hypothetical protein
MIRLRGERALETRRIEAGLREGRGCGDKKRDEERN